jgi:hypothetical protein
MDLYLKFFIHKYIYIVYIIIFFYLICEKIIINLPKILKFRFEIFFRNSDKSSNQSVFFRFWSLSYLVRKLSISHLFLQAIQQITLQTIQRDVVYLKMDLTKQVHFIFIYKMDLCLFLSLRLLSLSEFQFNSLAKLSLKKR